MRIGMAQILVEGGQLERNLFRAERFITQAGKEECEVVVLPECLDLGWTFPRARELAAPIPGPVTDRLCHIAHSTSIYVVAGITEKEGDRIYNSAVLLSPRGEILLKHRKINILDIAQGLYTKGDRLGVASTTLGCIGINICADNFAETLFLGQSLCSMGADLILSPCAWAVPAEHDNDREPYGQLWTSSYRTLAQQYGITIVGVSCVGWIEAGPWKGRKNIGCSLAMGRDGSILTKGPYGAEAELLLTVEVPATGLDLSS